MMWVLTEAFAKLLGLSWPAIKSCKQLRMVQLWFTVDPFAMYCILVLQNTWQNPDGEERIEVSRLGKGVSLGVPACFLSMYH